MNDSWVPFSRYILNTIIITGFGTVGHVIVASFAAYPLAKHNFPGKRLFFNGCAFNDVLMDSNTDTKLHDYYMVRLE